jgi:two-component system, cell cycle response regulator DivK
MSLPHVLVVEDNAMNADVLRENLIDAGYSFVLAVNGAAGVAIANEMLPDIILMDVNLPILDGLSATRLLKKNTTTQGIPIVALTARAMAGDQEMCLAAGCDDYISKPVDVNDLLAKMQHHLDRRPASFVEMIQRQRTMKPIREAEVKVGAVFSQTSTTNSGPDPEQVAELLVVIDRLEADLELAKIRITELDDALADREQQLTTAIKERDDANRDATGRVAKLTEERDRLRVELQTARRPSDAPTPQGPADQPRRSEEMERLMRRNRKLVLQLDLAHEKAKELQAQLESVPNDIRVLQGQYEGLRKAFLQLHRSVLKSAEDALHHVAFGSGP